MRKMTIGTFTVMMNNEPMDMPTPIFGEEDILHVPNTVLLLTDIDSGLIHYLFCYTYGRDYTDHPVVDNEYLPVVPEINTDWLGRRILEKLVANDWLEGNYDYHGIKLAMDTVPDIYGNTNHIDQIMLIPGVYVNRRVSLPDAKVNGWANFLSIELGWAGRPYRTQIHTVFDQLSWATKGLHCLVAPPDVSMDMVKSLQEKYLQYLTDGELEGIDPASEIESITLMIDRV